ncbi:hypothetical protein BH10ACI3_BH10ACI3_13900 [soil metagenome]
MRVSLSVLLIAVLTGSILVSAQANPGFGAVLLKGGTVKSADGTKKALVRKRFYLFAGAVKDNQPLVDRIRSTDLVSRDCFYSGINASVCFIKWLERANCESPLCRQVAQEEVASVKEFQSAYDKGFAQFNKRPDLALSWLVDNLSPELVSGFYRKQKSATDMILGGLKPLQTAITTGTDAEALFVDVPVVDKAAKYMISNLIPVEIGAKSYVWVCGVNVQRDKQTAVVINKNNCTITERDVRVCSTGTCDKL